MVAVLHLHGEAQRTRRAGHDGDLLYRRTVGLQRRHQRVADLVVRHDALFLVVQDLVLLLCTGQDGVHGLLQVVLGHGLAVVANGAQRGFVDDVGQLSAGSTGGHAGHNGKVAVGTNLDLFGVQAQDALAAFQVRQLHGYAAVKTAGAGQGRVQRFRPVGGGQNHNALRGVEAVHLGQQLVQGLLALVVAAQAAGTITLFADGIDLIDKHDAGRFFARLFEQVTHLGGTHAHEHLHKLTAGDGEEGHAGLASHSAGQQRFAGTRRAYQQHALGHFGADVLVLLGVV